MSPPTQPHEQESGPEQRRGEALSAIAIATRHPIRPLTAQPGSSRAGRRCRV